MATRGNEGSVEFKVTGDTSPLEASVAAAKAKIEAESSGAKAAGATTNAAEEVAKVGVAADASAEALNKMGQAGEKAVGDTAPLQSGLKGVNKALADSVGQAQALFGKLAIVAGTATGMFALGQAIRQYVVEALEAGSEKAKDFAASLNFNDSTKSAEALRTKIQQVEGDLAATKEQYDQLKQAGFDLVAVTTRGPLQQKKLEEELAELRRKLKVEESAANAKKTKDEADAAKKKSDADDKLALQEANRYIELQNARMDASAEYDERVQKSIDAEASARDRQIEDFRQSMKDLGDEMAKQAKRSQEAWVDSLRAIREESNRAFNTDQAATMVQLAGNLRTTATIASANMNRIVVGGDD